MSNSPANEFCYEYGKLYFYENGVKYKGWFEYDEKTYYASSANKVVIDYDKVIGGNTYYFHAIGSSMGSGYMCTESRTISGVGYEFTEDGVCLNK